MTVKQLEKFYKDCMKSGRLPGFGLCDSICRDDIMIFAPDDEESIELRTSGMAWAYWASGVAINTPAEERVFGFTPLRQTIVLFLIEMKKHPQS